MKNQQKSSTTKINIALFTTILLGINLSIPAFVAAQTVSTGEGEEVIQPGILELTTVPANFNFPAVNITDFLAYNTMYENQQTTPEKLTAEDKRFSGGFEVQVTATDYVGQINPANVITVDKLGISTQVPNSTNSYTQTVELQNGYSNSEGTLMSGSNTYGNVLTQTLPFNFPMFNRESNQIYICTNGFIIQAGDTAGLASSDFATTCSDGDPFPAGDYAIIQPYFENGGTYKLTEETGFFFDSNNGIYYNEVHIRFKGNVRPNPPVTSSLGNVEFTVYLFKDGRIEYHYGPNTDSTTIPVIGIYNTNPTTTISATEGDFDPGNLGSVQANHEIRFSPNNTLLSDVTKPGTPPVFAPTNSNSSSLPENYTMFTADIGNPGFSVPVTAMEGAACTNQGRLGSYTIYPSFLLQIDPTTVADTYQNTITFTIIDKTIASGTSFCP